MRRPPMPGAGARRGVTLLELLLSITLFALVLTAAVAVLGGGLRIWERARNEHRALDSALIALEGVARDLRSEVPFFAVPLQGDARACTFARPVRAGAGLPGIERIVLRVDASRGVLLREAARFPALDETVVDVLTEDVLDGALAYRIQAGEEWVWSDRADSNAPPIAVRIVLRMGPRGREKEVERHVTLPCR